MTDSTAKPKPPPGIVFRTDQGDVPGPLMMIAKVYMVQAACAVRDMEQAIAEMRKEMEGGSPLNDGLAAATIIHNAADVFIGAIAWLDSMATFLDMERKGFGVNEEVMPTKKKSN